MAGSPGGVRMLWDVLARLAAEQLPCLRLVAVGHKETERVNIRLAFYLLTELIIIQQANNQTNTTTTTTT